MMGQHSRSEALFYYFRLEDQVPETHLLRLIEKHISLAFVREKLKESYRGMGTIANVQADIVQLLSCRTTVAVALGLIGKSLGAIAGVVLSQSIVARAHVRRDAAIQQPLQKLPITIGRIRCYRRWLSPLPLDKAGNHVLCRNRLLTHACRRGPHAHDHATVIVHQVVIVVPQPSRGAALRGV